MRRVIRPGPNKLYIMHHPRRKFLRQSAWCLGGLLLQPLPGWSTDLLTAANEKKYGIQLWSLRDILGKDPWSLITKLAESGYRTVESFEGPTGVYWGKTPKEFAAFLKSNGLSMPSIHCNVFDRFEVKVAEAAEAGVQHVLCPWLGPQKTIDDFKKAAERFNTMGAICKKNGLRFGYHNHDYSFKELDKEIPQQILIEYTDRNLVDFEMDIFWVVAAGADPIEWFERYPNRFRLAHIKDRSKKPVADEGKNSVVVGTGHIDFESILRTGRAKGLKELIVEQEANYGAGPLESAIASLNYLKKLRG